MKIRISMFHLQGVGSWAAFVLLSIGLVLKLWKGGRVEGAMAMRSILA